MATPYIDPNLIFAENAPVQDKPAAFQNYDKGWDASRNNDGRPLIPQMNYLTQQADLKNLYIHENGAALPYKDGIAYEENAVVVKDGVLQQWKDGVWVEFLNDFANKDKVKRGIANRYDPLLTYNSGERVVLDNGDIVKSTIDGNTADPNVDMTGWENFELNTKHIKYANYRDAREFGVIPDKITDWTSVILSALETLPENSTLYIPQGTLWKATSDPDAVYAAMSDNSVLIDDSGYEDSYSTKYWQGSRQVYFKTKDYGSAGQANGNVQSYRFNYNGGISFENDAPTGSGACKGSLIWRFNKAANREAVQLAGDMTIPAQANLGVATYGGYANGATALRLGLQSSIAPHCFAINSALVQDCSFQVGKRVIRLQQGTPETDEVYKAAPHTTRISQPSGHTGNFDKLFYYGSSVARREILEETGRYRVITKNSKTLTTTADGEQFGAKLSVLTPTTNTALNESLSGSYYSNVSTGGTLPITLPKAIKGVYFEFSVDVAENLVIAPNAADNFTGMAAGKTKTSNVVGSHLRVVAISATQWSFVQSGTWTDQA